MDNITMNLIPESWAALVPSADVCIGGGEAILAEGQGTKRETLTQ